MKSAPCAQAFSTCMNSHHIIGLYKDGSVFKWHPVTDENHEVPGAADEITASPDGKLFLTSTSGGTVQVWNFAYMSVIYELRSSDLVTGLAFSPDCKRFYDIRGSSVNAWEPNCLIRLSESEESLDLCRLPRRLEEGGGGGEIRRPWEERRRWSRRSLGVLVSEPMVGLLLVVL